MQHGRNIYIRYSFHLSGCLPPSYFHLSLHSYRGFVAFIEDISFSLFILFVANPFQFFLFIPSILFSVDHTRVRLRLGGPTGTMNNMKEKDEYLNANFVDGFRKPKAYIATQGPMASTQNLFWRMLFEQEVKIIVMITHLFEGGKVKCDQYWPETGTQVYGDLSVTTVREDVLAFYTLRTFTLELISSPPVKKKKGGLEAGGGGRLMHTVYQYHYTAWPDHGVPLHALPLISFIRNSAAANAEDEPPVVVHCR